MKTLKKILAANILIALLIFTGCDIVHNDYDYDYTPPAPPSNIISITGDNRVDLTWDHNREKDLAGYNVYWSYSYDGAYELIGSTSDNYFIDWDAVNGETYYYAVTAYDYNGNESELSYDLVYDTPRPEGFNQSIYDYIRFPNNAGYSFSNYRVVAFNTDMTDFFFENYNGVFYLNVWEDTDIQDMGPTNDIWDISWAPDRGWVPLQPGENVKYTEAIEGHTYVVWTWDNHYAKVRISLITPERMVFDWAYQLVDGNRELKVNNLELRNSIPSAVLKGK